MVWGGTRGFAVVNVIRWGVIFLVTLPVLFESVQKVYRWWEGYPRFYLELFLSTFTISWMVVVPSAALTVISKTASFCSIEIPFTSRKIIAD